MKYTDLIENYGFARKMSSVTQASKAIYCYDSGLRTQYISQSISFSEVQTDVECSATDLEEAVKIALAEMPEESAKRIVLISDGNENEGDLQETAATVVASGCDFQIYKLE